MPTKPLFTVVFGKKRKSVVYRGFGCLHYVCLAVLMGKENGRGKLGFAVNQGAVNRGFTVHRCNIENVVTMLYAMFTSQTTLS